MAPRLHVHKRACLVFSNFEVGIHILSKYVIHFDILKDCFLLRKSGKKLSKLKKEGKELQKVNSLKSSTYINQARSENISEKQSTTQFTVYQFSISAI